MFERRIDPVRVTMLGDTQVLGGAFFALCFAHSLLGVADSIRLPASMSLFADEGEQDDSVASAMSLRSISRKVGQVTGPVLVGTTMDVISTEAGFLLAAAFIVVATGDFAVTATRAYRERDVAGEPAPTD